MKLAAAVLLAASAAGCAAIGPETLKEEPGWVLVPDVPVVRQEQEQDCGAAALAMLLASWKQPVPADAILAACPDAASGIRAADLRDVARGKGLKAFVIAGTPDDLARELEKRRPVLVGLVKEDGLRHYEVVVGLHPERRRIALIDPARGWVVADLARFLLEWEAAGRVALVVFASEKG